MAHVETRHIVAENPKNEQKRKRLFEIIRNKSLISGEPITLTSGRVSDYYFNTKPTMLDAEGAGLIATLMLDAFEDLEVDLVGGLEMGAVPIASSIAAVSFLENRPVGAFFVRKQAKGHGTKSLIEGLQRGVNMNGKNVVVVDDVTTTGGSSIKAVEMLKEEGAIVHRVISIIDRQEGALEAFENANIPYVALFGGQEFR